MSALKWDKTLGAAFMGTSLSMSLWGITCVQTYDYFRDNKSDGLLQKSVVALLLAMNSLCVAMSADVCYYYLVKSYANPFALLDRPWALNMTGAVMGFVTTIIRTMFARRIYQFGGRFSVIITTWIMALSIVDFLAAVMITVKCFGNISSLAIQELRLSYITVIVGLVTDLSITIALTWLLQSAKTGFRRSDSILNALIIYVLNTGILVTIGSTVGVIVYLVIPDYNLIFYGVFMVYNKLYVNGYLASLNARSRLRTTMPTPDLYPLSRMDPRRTTSTGGDKSTSSGVATSTMTISLHTTVERIVDGIDDDKPFAV